MNLSKINLYITKFVLCIFLMSCGNLEQNQENLESPTKVGIQQLKFNGKFLVPFPIQLKNLEDPLSNDSTVFEFNSSKNELVKSNFVLPKYFVGAISLEELHYIATSQAIATYKLNSNGLEKQSYLPTPKGNFIASCFLHSDLVATLTVSDFSLNIWLWQNNKWQLHKKIDCEKNKTPSSTCTYIENASGRFIFWGKNKFLYYINIEAEDNRIYEMPFADLENTCVWSNNDSTYLSGFNANFELKHFELKNLETKNVTSVKTELGNYPDFKAPLKYVALMPIIINQDLKGFVYGAIGEKIVYISSDKKEFPTSIIRENEQKIRALFLTNIGVLIAIIFIISILSIKIAKAWEARLAKLTMPANALFFGPTLHRGIAFCIDLLTILQITLILSYFLPFNLNFYLEMLNSFSMESNTILLEKQYPFLIASYIISLIYGTLTEYFLGFTLGKYCLGLEVFSDRNFSRINFFQALGRNLIPKFSPNIYLILFSNISISVTQKKKSLHDYMGNTVVLYSRLHKKLNLKISHHKL